MDEYALESEEEWLDFYNGLPPDIKDRVKKKLIQLKYLP